MNPSERIRAALQKSDGSKHTHEPPTAEPAQPETTLPLLASSDAKRALARSEAPLTDAADNEPSDQDALRSVAVRYSKSHRRNYWIYIAAAAAILLAAGGVFLFRGRPAGGTADGNAASTPDHPLQVEAVSEGNGRIKVRWNTHSASVTHASEGRLFIMERGQPPRLVALDPDQLKIGHLSYQSAADGVEFRLEVISPSGAVTQETVGGKSGASPQPAVASTPAAPVPQPEKPSPLANSQPAAAAAAKPVEAQLPPVAEPERAPKQEARAFIPPPVNRKNAPEEHDVMLDPTTAVPAGSVIRPGAVLPEMPKVAPPPEPRPAPPAPRQLNVGGNVQAANLVKKVAPVYPALAKTAHVQGKVIFSAVIGKDGSVQNLKAVSGHQMLVPAATDAVKKWIYKPTLLNGNPIEVVTQIEVDFSLKD